MIRAQMKQVSLEKECSFHFQRPFLLKSRVHPTAVYWSYQSDQLSVQPSQNIRSLLWFSSVHSQSCHQHGSCFLVKRSFYMLELTLCICPTIGIVKGSATCIHLQQNPNQIHPPCAKYSAANACNKKLEKFQHRLRLKFLLFCQRTDMKYSLSGYGGDTNAFLCTGVLILSDKLHCPSASLRYWCVVLQMKQSKPSKQAGFSIALYTTENSRASFEQSQSKYKLEMDQRRETRLLVLCFPAALRVKWCWAHLILGMTLPQLVP